MTSNEYLLLFEKFLSGEASPEEIEMIMAHRDEFEMPDLTPENYMQYAGVKNRILVKLEVSIKPERQRKIYFYRWLAATAAVFLLAAAVYFCLVALPGSANNGQQLARTRYQNDISSPGIQATLTLANGRIIPLKEFKNITLLKQKTTLIKSNGNGIIQYSRMPLVAQNTMSEYNSISTANGGRYAVILSDGTKVWLNAASTLTYPTAFIGSERKVQLTGEAYFEVAKNKYKPFKVEFNHQVVQVLGTHFNIMAYADEDHNSATLLEGSIQMTHGDATRVIRPGEQATSVNGIAGMTVRLANTEDVMAWKNGYFLFKNENIHAIMRKVSRWYNVDVQYDGNMQNQVFGGRISTSENISKILKSLELTGTIHFKLEGRRITVME